MSVLRLVLFGFGYPASIAVISRFVPVVREQRTRWLLVHHVAVLCIVVGWATVGRWSGVVVNSAWLVAATLWYVAGGRRRRRAEAAPTAP